jgi:monoamine oxidase
MFDAEVAVIGAGVAGLAAFQRLRQAGRSAVLLEARDRIGGRVLTETVPDWPLPIELGAEFIHGTPPELLPWAGEEPERRNWALAGGHLLPAPEFTSDIEAVFERIARLPELAPDESFAAFLDRQPDLNPEARQAALAFIEGFEAADPRRISVLALKREFAQDNEWAGPHRPRGGYGAWLTSLAPAGSVSLGTVVQVVRWRPGLVEIEAERHGHPHRWQVRQAIVTLPVSLLQTSLATATPIAFEPPLEAKREALRHLAMGAARRITLRFQEPVWTRCRDDAGHGLAALGFLFGRALPEGRIATWWTAAGSRDGAAQITGWLGGRRAWALAGLSAERLAGIALDSLSAVLCFDRAEFERALLGVHTHDWESDPFAQGAYSYATLGGANAFAALATPLDATLFFAGEATDNTGANATVQGALRSGRRAAAELLAAV